MASAAALVAVASTGAYAGATLDAVKSKGYLQCGVTTGLPGFSNPDDKGNWTGIDVDTCRGVAAAVFGDASKVKFTPLTAKERFTALQSGEIEILSRNTTWTLTRDSSLGINFAGVNYYDGQGFLVTKSLGVKSALELDGASFCIQAGTTTELNLADYFRANKMSYTPITFDKSDETEKAYEPGRCNARTPDQSPAVRPAHSAQGSRRRHRAAGRSSPRSRWARSFGRATTSGSTSCAGACARC